MLVLDFGVAGAALGAVVAEMPGFAAGLAVRAALGGTLACRSPGVFDRERLGRLFAINRDIMIRTAALITAFFFFTAQGARAGDTLLAANAVLHNFTLIGSFFLDGFATAAEQLCGRSVGARDRTAFSRAVQAGDRLGLRRSGSAPRRCSSLGGTALIDLMTASPEVREAARQFLVFAALAPAAGVLAYAYDGIYIGATWARDMRNLMIAALRSISSPGGRCSRSAMRTVARATASCARGLLQAAIRLVRRRSAGSRRVSTNAAACRGMARSRLASLRDRRLRPAREPASGFGCTFRDMLYSGHGSAVTAAASRPTAVVERLVAAEAEEVHQVGLDVGRRATGRGTPGRCRAGPGSRPP